jgi:hypothetical protein
MPAVDKYFIMRDLLNIISPLFEAPEEVRAQIDDKLEKIPDEADLKDILKFTNRYTIKKDVVSFTTLRQYKDIVSNVLLRALADAEIPEDDVRKFLDKLSKDGILDEKLLLTPGQIHTFEQIVDPEYRTIFDAIKVDVFRDIAGKIGELGDVGKGEYLLDIMSPNINRRGAPGDLDINGTKIELKAGENGRLGPAGSMSIAGRFQREFVPVLKELMPEADISQLDPIAFNPKQDMKSFTAFFDSPEKVKTALTAMLKMHYPSYDVESITNAVVDSSGNINGLKLKEEMLKASFTVYKQEKEFDGIIIMDSAVTKFLYIGSPEEMAKSANLVTVSFPSWNDTQSNAMKLTLAKGRASGKATTAAAQASAERQAAIDTKIQDIAQRTPISNLRPERDQESRQKR